MQIDDVATTPRLCRAVIVTLANDRPSCWRVAWYRMGSSARPSRVNTVCWDLTAFVRKGQAGDSEELTEELAAEYAVVIQLLIAPLELGHVVAGVLLSGARRRHRMKIKACEEIGPEIGHSLSVSLVLRQRERNSQATWQRIRGRRNPRLRRR